MPFSDEGVAPGIALALSGGGFRATLFHIGGLWRLNETGFLPRLDRVSSISGGSITAGFLGLKFGQLHFDASGNATNFGPLVVDPLRAFCSKDIDVFAVGEGALLPWKKASDVVERAYRDHLFGEATLQDLPLEKPRFVINATNFGTGVSFRFSRPYAGDYRIGLIKNPTFRISTAVAASSGFPPVLSPVILRPDPNSFVKTEGADLYDNIAYRQELVLTDGGVYDNLGLETVWNRYDTLLVSDAGAPFELQGTPRHELAPAGAAGHERGHQPVAGPAQARADLRLSAGPAQRRVLGHHDSDCGIRAHGYASMSSPGDPGTGRHAHPAQLLHGSRAVPAYQLGLRRFRCGSSALGRGGEPAAGRLAVPLIRAG